MIVLSTSKETLSSAACVSFVASRDVLRSPVDHDRSARDRMADGGKFQNKTPERRSSLERRAAAGSDLRAVGNGVVLGSRPGSFASGFFKSVPSASAVHHRGRSGGLPSRAVEADDHG